MKAITSEDKVSGDIDLWVLGCATNAQQSYRFDYLNNCFSNLPYDISISMSSLTQTVSAQFAHGWPSPGRGSIASAGFGSLPQRRLSRDFMTEFNLSASPSLRQLHDLNVELDHQCLLLAADGSQAELSNATSDVDLVVELAVFLSGTLSHAGHPGTHHFHLAQLRALMSSLALLHHYRVHSLSSELWDRLQRENLASLFSTITCQITRRSTLSERIRHAPNAYLVQLACQYVSFIRRGNSTLPAIIGPIVQIFFASVSVVRRLHPRQITADLIGIGWWPV